MKKLIAFVLALVCVLVLVGCSEKRMTFDIGNATQIQMLDHNRPQQPLLSKNNNLKDYRNVVLT